MSGAEAQTGSTSSTNVRHGCPVTETFGQQVLHVDRSRLVDVAKLLLDEGFDMCIDVTAVDHLRRANREVPAGVGPERFEVVVNLLSMSRRDRLRLKVQVPADDPVVPSLFNVHPGSEAHEREVFDMFGISFDGHPDMTRILMPEDWDGHPLRKDYEQGRIPVQFKGVRA